MKRTIVISVLAVVGIGLAVVGGLRIVGQLEQREVSAAEELRLQRATIAELKEGVVSLAMRANEANARRPAATGGEASLPQATVELAVQKAMATQAEHAKEAHNAEPELSQTNLEASVQGDRLLDNAIAAKRWTDADVASLRDITGRMAGLQTAELMRRVSVAINDGKIAVQVSGPLF